MNNKFELPGGPYSVSDIQEYFEYIINKKQKAVTDNLPIRTYVNKKEFRITIKTKTGYHIETLTLETMKLLQSTKNKVTKDKNLENMLHLEITEAVLVHSNIANYDYQHDPRVLYTFVQKKSFGQLLFMLHQTFIYF